MSPDGMRLFGVEDGSFKAFPKPRSEETLLCGVETEGDRIVGVRLARIHVDGLDATEKLLGMLTGVKAEAVILGGITFGGFNIVDPQRIQEMAGVPVIVYSGVKPDNESMLSALRKHFADWRVRWEIIERLGPVYSAEPFGGEPPVYFEVIGGVRDLAEDVLRVSAVVSRIPEPVRVAGLIARGLSRVF